MDRQTERISREVSLEVVRSSRLESPLVMADRLSRVMGTEVYLKLESRNPSGSQKDRAALANVLYAKREGKRVVTAGTCGNYGAALAYYASKYGLEAHIFIPAGFTGRRVAYMESLGARVVRVEGHYEDAVETSSKLARERGWHDANPGGLGGRLGILGYMSIARELVDRLGGVPEEVYVPVGNGTTLAGIWRGFLELRREGKISRLPRMIGVTTKAGNPVLTSFQRGLSRAEELDPSRIVETEINEPLVNYRAYDGDEALRAILDSGGAVYGYADRELAVAARLFVELSEVRPIPASASVLLPGISREPQGEGPWVLVITQEEDVDVGPGAGADFKGTTRPSPG